MLTHPQVIHFPIALLLMAILFDFIALFWKQDEMMRAAFILLITGTLFSIIATLTGDNAAQQYAGHPELTAIIFDHEQAGEWVRNYYILIVLMRSAFVISKRYKRAMMILFIAFHLAGALLIYRAGDLGGKLVYDHGLGVKSLPLKIEGRLLQ